MPWTDTKNTLGDFVGLGFGVFFERKTDRNRTERVAKTMWCSELVTTQRIYDNKKESLPKQHCLC